MPFPFDLKSQLGITGNPLMRCACGRDVNMDMMRDVRPIAATTGWSESHRCDSCVEHLHRTGKLSREAFYRAQGAPAAIIAIHAAQDAAIKAARNG